MSEPCAKCGATATVKLMPYNGEPPFWACSPCAGLESHHSPPVELWALERHDGTRWRPIPGCSSENEHAARNVAQALLLMSPGLSADTFRVTRYTPAVAS